jgi:hypothetical protein
MKSGAFAPSLGTLRFLAPEQLDGQETLPQSDIYSLGVVFHEILTGKPPYSSGEPNTLRREIGSGTQISREVPKRLSAHTWPAAAATRPASCDQRRAPCRASNADGKGPPAEAIRGYKGGCGCAHTSANFAHHGEAVNVEYGLRLSGEPARQTAAFFQTIEEQGILVDSG